MKPSSDTSYLSEPSICLLLDYPLSPQPAKLLSSILSAYGLHHIKTFTLVKKEVFIFDKKSLKRAYEANRTEILNSIHEFNKFLDSNKPNLILSPGRLGVFSLCDSKAVEDWRSSILSYNSRKFICTYGPDTVEFNYSLYPIFSFDIQKAIQESKNLDFNYPIINYIINPLSAEELLQEEVVSCDIETTRGEDKKLLCIGFGVKDRAYVFSFSRHNDSIIRSVLSSNISKIFHHGAFDINVLLLKGYELNNCTEDTIIQAQILEPELPRSLAFLNSIYTKLPYYKEEGRSNIPEDDKSWKASRSQEDLFLYNARDVWCTYQIWEAQTKELKELGLYDLYRFAIKSHEAAISISQSGMLLDKDVQEAMRKKLEEERKELYLLLTRLTKKIVNPRSPKDMPLLLYEHMGLPKKYGKKKDAETGKKNLTTDEDAIVSLIGFAKNQLAKYKSEDKQYEWMSKVLTLQVILKLRGIEKLLSSYVNITTSQDGRVRSIFKVHATETGRWAASKFVDETGVNLQTIPRG